MSEHPMATPADPHAYKATVMAVRNLFRRQAVTVEQAWAILLQREGGPEAMPAGAEGRTRELLAEFGYDTAEIERLVAADNPDFRPGLSDYRSQPDYRLEQPQPTERRN